MVGVRSVHALHLPHYLPCPLRREDRGERFDGGAEVPEGADPGGELASAVRADLAPGEADEVAHRTAAVEEGVRQVVGLAFGLDTEVPLEGFPIPEELAGGLVGGDHPAVALRLDDEDPAGPDQDVVDVPEGAVLDVGEK